MTLETLQKQKPEKITVNQATQIMGVTPQFLRIALQYNKFSFGTAVKFKRWSYYINTERFIRYMKGV